MAAGPALAKVRRRILEHYDRFRRDLPWRAEPDSYRIWVSEVMLQQTRAETVAPYYRRWMERFPDLESLAEAEEDEVLRAWEGLGYYARARNLHIAARLVRDRHGGRLPPDPEALRRLPGVGEYTAGAVASIAFGVAAPAVDGNVRRVLCRLLDLASPSPAELRECAARLMDRERPGDFNQALMDLGAAVCVPRTPRCTDCPVASDCLARSRGTVNERPLRRRRARAPERSFAVAVLVDPAGRLLLSLRPHGLLGGLWAFPEKQLSAGESKAAAARQVARSFGFPRTSAGPSLPPIRHAFTHFRALYFPVLLRVPVEAPSRKQQRWVDGAAPAEVALPAAQKRIALAAARALERAGRSGAAGSDMHATPRE